MADKKSSCVESHQYDNHTKKLTVFYTNHTVYDYEDVPPSVALGLFRAESKGKYLNANVKGIYAYTKR